MRTCSSWPPLPEPFRRWSRFLNLCTSRARSFPLPFISWQAALGFRVWNRFFELHASGTRSFYPGIESPNQSAVGSSTWPQGAQFNKSIWEAYNLASTWIRGNEGRYRHLEFSRRGLWCNGLRLWLSKHHKHKSHTFRFCVSMVEEWETINFLYRVDFTAPCWISLSCIFCNPSYSFCNC